MEGKRAELDACGMEEVCFFMEKIVPVYLLTLDELDNHSRIFWKNNNRKKRDIRFFCFV